MNIKERLRISEYRWAVALVYGGCLSMGTGILYEINGSASDSTFDPKNSYYMWLILLIAALLSNLLFDPRGRDCYKSFQVRYPRFLKAIFKARFFGAFYDAVLGARLRDFYMVLSMMPFVVAMHEISAYCGHPSNFLVECLVILGLQCFLKLCTKLGW
ncbi:hypothetical protein HG560_03510 [Helicobacter pylori]|uniref:Uncharacterized protein n=1 Tax=Helicobacter pylori TaxID=210 RepID=A0AAE7P954_HELPX|nr:hypothetical protein [Helicobacter pylori]AFI00926.1 hypothetical protein HPSH112_03610 [Helicobacter pylori Shi112]QQW93608.1 hypothetical protein HG560_03510 [Helicobacter pylori]QQX50978.1 hypothetical protein HG562_03515 [Helicobacter pylori]